MPSIIELIEYGQNFEMVDAASRWEQDNLGGGNVLYRYIIGSNDGAGIVMKTKRHTGEIIWIKRYSFYEVTISFEKIGIGGSPVNFIGIVGHIVINGVKRIMALRIDAEGNLHWAKSFGLEPINSFHVWAYAYNFKFFSTVIYNNKSVVGVGTFGADGNFEEYEILHFYDHDVKIENQISAGRLVGKIEVNGKWEPIIISSTISMGGLDETKAYRISNINRSAVLYGEAFGHFGQKHELLVGFDFTVNAHFLFTIRFDEMTDGPTADVEAFYFHTGDNKDVPAGLRYQISNQDYNLLLYYYNEALGISPIVKLELEFNQSQEILNIKPEQNWRKKLNIDTYKIVEVPWGWPQALLGQAKETLGFYGVTNSNLDTCISQELPKLDFSEGLLSKKEVLSELISITPNIIEEDLIVMDIEPEFTQLCPPPVPPVIVPKEEGLIQSPYLYFQAAGSDTTDHSARGIHLRWGFQRSLEQHFAKGNLSTTTYPTTIGFNRANDFVNIYRAKYDTSYPIAIDFQNPPDEIIDTGSERKWRYTGLSGASNTSNTVVLNFKDAGAYDTAKTQANPLSQTYSFIQAYLGVIEFHLEGALFFNVQFHERIAQTWTNYVALNIECISIPDYLDAGSRFLSCRRKIETLPEIDAPSIFSENVETIRVKFEKNWFQKVEFYTYRNALFGLAQANKFESVGSFAITDNTTEAYKRLEDTSKFSIDKSWGKYNENNPSSGAFTVKVANYKSKWSATDGEGLREGVINYLNLSKTDVTATENILMAQDNFDDIYQEMSYLDMLRLVSLDYHVARMLGLGHIDAMPQSSENDKYIYLAEYITEAPLEHGQLATLNTHYFLSLPTNQKDHRLPPNPVMKPVTYGLFVDNGTSNPTNLADANGYVPQANDPHNYVRYINLFKQAFIYDKPIGSFFETNTEFCFGAEQSRAALFGIEYKKDGESTFRNPEILNDEDFLDHAQKPEVIAIPDTDEPGRPLYRHKETEEGIHWYGAYSINRFSRVSPVSNLVPTNETIFPKRNSLLPPFNFSVQLIQEESPLIFTTTAEQNKLQNLTTSDKTLVRATFDWNYIHNNNFQYADQVEFLFRTNEPLAVQGEITSVSPLSNHRVRITTNSYNIQSTNPVSHVIPEISAGDVSKFEGSLLIANEKSYQVESVTSGVNPEFILKQIRQTATSNADLSGSFITHQNYLSPNTGERFLVYENLSNNSSWDYKLTKRVDLELFLPNGPNSPETGITDTTTIQEHQDIYAIDHPDVIAGNATAGQPIPGSRTGVFNIEFDNETLPNLADPETDFYKGTIRISEDPSLFTMNDRPPEIKVLQIWKIDSYAPLRIIAFDPRFDANASTTNPDPETDYISIPTGNNIEVNFHPSYRTYLKVEGQFSETNILPAQGTGFRKTFMAARSVATTDKDGNPLNPPCYSGASPPVVLLALENVKPEPPGEPTGPIFATRPDFYGKSTYTFDAVVQTNGRTPYAVVFYRSDERKILDTLYKPDTVEDILNELYTRYGENDKWFQDRWYGLVNTESSNGNQFDEYNGYRFPIPDNDQYEIPNSDASLIQNPFSSTITLATSFSKNLYRKPDNTIATESLTMIDIVKEAIEGAFFPLTEKPILYKYIKNGRITSPSPPKVRDLNDQLIVPSDIDNIDFNVFDPYPMAVKFTDSGETNIRFTDYKLDGASNSFFFYFGVELSDKFEVSAASPVKGPVQLINSNPPEKIGIKKVTTQLANPIQGIPTAVVFEINEYLESEKIKKIQIFRSTDPIDSLSVRNMNAVKEIDIGSPIIDDFDDLDFPPYGQPIYYRLAALREIINEEGYKELLLPNPPLFEDITRELIPSIPSELVVASVVDNFNPPAPELDYEKGTETTSPLTYPNVKLKWQKTVHNGYYHIYKMNASGNWAKIGLLNTNDAAIEFPLIDRDPPTIDDQWEYWDEDKLIKEDADTNPVYHHFKVIAENGSGLLSLEELIMTI